jgi:hopene-associated glycosyltransferase HpnB
MLWIYLLGLAAALWLVILLLPWRPWQTRELLEADASCNADLSDVTALIPARNEAAVIRSTLAGLGAQGSGLKIIVVDDRSTDNTAAAVRELSAVHLTLIQGRPLPPSWTGKLWALEQGFGAVQTPYTLLLDADIMLLPALLPTVLQKLKTKRRQMVSLMAEPRMDCFWGKLLMPAFVYFFKMLYPFHLSNDGFRWFAAAAGGCLLVETRAIRQIGGFHAIRRELIDDCALARRLQTYGLRTWTGLTRSVKSQRHSEQLGSIWQMVARTAFHQLRYSLSLLLLTTIVMLILFWLPVAALFWTGITTQLVATVTLALMMISYLPTLVFYGRSRLWAVTLPLIAALYLAMTWTSALRHWTGAGATWKKRSYQTHRHY